MVSTFGMPAGGGSRCQTQVFDRKGESVTDAVTVIKQDHQMVGQLFELYQQAQDAPTKQDLVRQITDGLALHAEMEEQVLYPKMEQALGADEMSRNVEEHNEMREGLAQLASMSPDQADYDQTVQTLIKGVMDHVRLEEEDELPRLQQQLSQEELEQIGSEMERFKAGA